MTRKVIAACALCLVYIGVATSAVYTERNGVYKGVGCYTPPKYTFVGLDSCWIPYGTYTGGTGGTEYTRVTDRLMGVMASAIGGLAEREHAISGGDSTYMLRPLGLADNFSLTDDGSFLSSSTNLSFRISDQLNVNMIRVVRQDTNYYYNVDYHGLEDELLSRAYQFGSRRLDSLTGDATPPIASAWSSKMPFSTNDIERWRNVYPTYGRCTNDMHFTQRDIANEDYWSDVIFPDIDYEIWGDDIAEALEGEDGLRALTSRSPINCTIEDVLSYDTGFKYPARLTNDYWTVDGRQLNRASISGEWDDLAHAYVAYWDCFTNGLYYVIQANNYATEWIYFCYDPQPGEYVFSYYSSGSASSKSFNFEGHSATKTEFWDSDDYAHWTNGTYRLDWKRLGIICQLERQMEITYDNNEGTDTLPVWDLWANDDLTYKAEQLSIPLPKATGNGQIMEPATGILNQVSWELEEENYQSSTNIYSWGTPTCRVAPPILSGNTRIDELSSQIRLEYDEACDVISAVCGGLESSNELSRVILTGTWGPGSGMSLHFECTEARAIVKLPSNTVEVAVSDGFSQKETRDYPIVQDDWTFQENDKTLLFSSAYLGDGGIGLSYTDRQSDTEGTYVNFSMSQGGDFDGGNGSFTTPQVVATAVGSGDPTNWMWRVTGLDGYDISNCVRSVSESEGKIEWTWSGKGGAIRYMSKNGDNRYSIDFVGSISNNASIYAGQSRIGELPQSWSSLAVSATWISDFMDSPDFREIGIGSGASYGIGIAFDTTNATTDAFAYVGSEAWATFTYASADSKAETISRFSPNYSYSDWDRINTHCRSELEMILYASGDPATFQSFTWPAIKNYETAGRQFRMIGGTTVQSLQSANNARYDLLSALSAECKAKCNALGGIPVSVVGDFGKVPSDFAESFIRSLASGKITGQFYIQGGRFTLEATVNRDGGTYDVVSITSPETFPVLIGGCGWSFGIDASNHSASTSNRYESVRADAYQAPVTKRVWKFKNLRDPNL